MPYMWLSKIRTSEDSCQYFYDFEQCNVLLKPNAGDCSVYCSYGTIPCPNNNKTRIVVNFEILMVKEFDKKLKARNIKPTAIRQLVYEVLEKQKKALSLYEIEQQFDNVERSTIFRTLKTFQDNYLIHSIDDGTGAVKYALCDDDCTCKPDDLHIHFLCNKCGQTHCMKDMPVPKMDLPEDFSFESANFVVKGTCPNCL